MPPTRPLTGIALAVGAVDPCSYCQSAHTLAVQTAGFTAAETVAIRRGSTEAEPKLAAMLNVAREIAGQVGDVSDAGWQAALRAGWSDVELTEPVRARRSEPVHQLLQPPGPH